MKRVDMGWLDTKLHSIIIKAEVILTFIAQLLFSAVFMVTRPL